jgi:hypothetical protein
VDELKNTLTELSNEYINEQYQIIEDDSLNRPDKKDKLQEHNKAFINNWIDTVDTPSVDVPGVRLELNTSFREWEKGEWKNFQDGLREKEAIIQGQIAQLDAAIDPARRNWNVYGKKRGEGGEVEAGVDREQKWWKPWEKAENPAAAAAERKKAEWVKVMRDRYADSEKVKSQEKIKARNAELAAAPKEAISDEDEEELEKAGERKKDGPIQWFLKKKKKKSDKYTEDPVVDAANQDAANPDAANMV